MIHHDVSQRSPEWFEIRLGLATASCFDKIVTPVKGEISKSCETYANQLIGELISDDSIEKFESPAMERGGAMEQEAILSYKIITDYTLVDGGFLTDDTMTFGASPDARVLDQDGNVIGGAEIKCPLAKQQVANLLRGAEIDPSHKPQVQGQMLIGELGFIDWFSYHPKTPPALARIIRDDDYCEKLSKALTEFKGILDDKIERLKKMGVLIPEPPIFEFHRKATDKIPEFLASG